MRLLAGPPGHGAAVGGRWGAGAGRRPGPPGRGAAGAWVAVACKLCCCVASGGMWGGAGRRPGSAAAGDSRVLARPPFPPTLLCLASSQEDDRRIAEVQYKRCCALQFGGDPEGALAAVQVGSWAQVGRSSLFGWRPASCGLAATPRARSPRCRCAAGAVEVAGFGGFGVGAGCESEDALAAVQVGAAWVAWEPQLAPQRQRRRPAGARCRAASHRAVLAPSPDRPPLTCGSSPMRSSIHPPQAALDCLAKRRAALQAKLAAPGEGEDAEKMRAGAGRSVHSCGVCLGAAQSGEGADKMRTGAAGAWEACWLRRSAVCLNGKGAGGARVGVLRCLRLPAVPAARRSSRAVLSSGGGTTAALVPCRSRMPPLASTLRSLATWPLHPMQRQRRWGRCSLPPPPAPCLGIQPAPHPLIGHSLHRIAACRGRGGGRAAGGPGREGGGAEGTHL